MKNIIDNELLITSVVLLNYPENSNWNERIFGNTIFEVLQ